MKKTTAIMLLAVCLIASIAVVFIVRSRQNPVSATDAIASTAIQNATSQNLLKKEHAGDYIAGKINIASTAPNIEAAAQFREIVRSTLLDYTSGSLESIYGRLTINGVTPVPQWKDATINDKMTEVYGWFYESIAVPADANVLVVPRVLSGVRQNVASNEGVNMTVTKFDDRLACAGSTSANTHEYEVQFPISCLRPTGTQQFMRVGLRFRYCAAERRWVQSATALYDFPLNELMPVLP
jgi:hypothetical protein